MQTVPCHLCGYDAPGQECRHCHHTAAEPSLADPRPSVVLGVLDGLRAVPTGLFFLATTSGIKRFLIPPFLLTLALFALLFWWSWGGLNALLDAAALQDISSLELEEGWLQDVATWLVEKQVVVWTARLSGWLVLVLTSSLVALYTFSVAYEALSGPFLDEIQGRLEERWFGRNPRNTIQRPTDLGVSRCIALSVGVCSVAVVAVAAWWTLSGATAWLALLAIPLAVTLAVLVEREYGVWLWWVLRVEGHTLWVSVKASLLALLVLLLFFWLKFIPVVGYILFVALAGFSTAITLLDIPFSRRQWSLEKRLQFMLHQFLPTVAFGAVASLLFLIPVLGPILMVPAASIGGQWLICRLDKSSLRPKALRVTGEAPEA
ncbi:MAG: hypothetical protein CMJ84_09985 [Planctomycetes bacterium]|jgi:uncharacterized protein involved in cysteine biosynthesis|nr:hypothetical protein [Planctomycetota bacterium]MDP6408179.1 EI24 domain-containing protein [Planctomycetota bacterium]